MEKRIALLSLCVLVSLLGTWSLAASAPAVTPSFTVNSTVDAVDDHPGDGICHTAAGACTLRAAIMEANKTSGAIIHVPTETYTLTIPPGTGGDADGDLNIDSSMTIEGSSPPPPVIASSVGDRVFDVGPGVVAAMEHLYITNGALAAGLGGGIRNRGSLALTAVNIVGNNAVNGGGIYSSGALTMTLSTITSNSALAAAGLYVYPGSTATLTQVQVDSNSAAGYGGGILNAGTLTMNSGATAFNTASDGGGIYVVANGATTDLIGTIVLSNTVTNRGGGLFKAAGTSLLNLSWAEIEFNTADAQGGGVYIDGPSTQPVTIEASAIHDNSAFGYGGGGYLTKTVVLMTNSAVYGNSTNSSAAHGGGLFNGGVLTMTNSTVSGNWGVGNGGGIYNQIGGSLGLYNATIAYNVSGTEYDGWPGSNYPGGGIANHLGGVVLQNTLIAQNNLEDSFSNLVPNDCWGALTSQDYNLIQTISGSCTVDGSIAHNKTGVDPQLGPLQQYGQVPGQVRPLLLGSPAIDAGNPAGCTDWQGALLFTDQRYFMRTVDGDHNGSVICDIGAYEYGSAMAQFLFLPLVKK